MEITREMLVEERERRLKILSKLMEDENLDAIACHGNGAMAYQADLKYMTDLVTPCGRMYSFMEKGRQPVAITGRPDSQFHAKIKTFLEPENVLCVSDQLKELMSRIDALPGARPRVGVPSLPECPKVMTDLLLSSRAEIVDITDSFVKAKAPKAPYEIQRINEASDLTLDSFEEVVRFIEPGKTEKEVIGMAEGYLRAYGAEDLLILTRSTKPHSFINRPTFKKIGPDDVFVYSAEIAGIRGYWTQIIRPIFMSKKAHPDAYDVLCASKEAIAAGVEKFVPGNRISDVGEAVSRVAKKYNLKEGIWSGHGMGIDLGDGISIGISNSMEIVPNMVMTLHPSFLSATDGVLYADTFLSTEGKAVCLTDKYTGTPYLDELREIIH
jgi:Xaa-Pro aminopeptidase